MHMQCSPQEVSAVCVLNQQCLWLRTDTDALFAATNLVLRMVVMGNHSDAHHPASFLIIIWPK